VNAVVRPAEAGDAQALVELAREVGEEREAWLLTSGEWRTATEERRYLRAVRRSRDAAVFVAEDAGILVGRLSVARDPHPSSHHVADVGLMISRSHRRRGIGLALMEVAEAWARSVGVEKLELHVFPHNEPAKALYERLGYRKEGFRRRHYRRGSDYLDAILMAKDL
jgi:RimJ/RimL family protein N-acetyltransferase